VETTPGDQAVLAAAARMMKVKKEFARAEDLQAGVSRIPRELPAPAQPQ
jgi:hypothetical protein